MRSTSVGGEGRALAFGTSHPVVPAAYLVGVTGLCMLSPQPVCAGISLVGALALSLVTRGPMATLRGLRWQLPLLVIVCLANPLFSASGSTELVRLGPLAVYLESLAYGACMGMMLVAMLLWFSCAPYLLTQDAVLALGPGPLPTVTLMVSMTAQLVPQLVRRGTQVRSTLAACSAASGEGARHEGVRMSNVLVSWAMEDSLERADAMRARGWGAVDGRTSYRTLRFRLRDAVALSGLVALVLACASLSWVACSQWHFYPTMPRLVVWWGYVPLAVLALLPTALELVGRLGWRS